jgi:hypothetical protein
MEALLELPPLERAEAAARLMDAYRSAISRIATLREQALVEARFDGVSAAAIAHELGITRQQVHRLTGEVQAGGRQVPRPMSAKDVIEAATAAGWSATASGKPQYTKLQCPCGKHVTFLQKTPSNPRYFNEAARRLKRLCS